MRGWFTAGPTPTASASSWRILEREHELAELNAAALQAKDGDGSVVLISGEAGIGKSNLVGAARALLPAASTSPPGPEPRTVDAGGSWPGGIRK